MFITKFDIFLRQKSQNLDFFWLFYHKISSFLEDKITKFGIRSIFSPLFIKITGEGQL